MHDPCTLAFTLPRPWPERARFRKGKRWSWPRWVDVWHVDPETDGSDDSCGWAFAKVGDQDRKLLDEMATWDRAFPFYGTPAIRELTVILDPAYSFPSLPPGQAFGFIAAAWMEIKARKTGKHDLTAREITWIMRLACNPHDGLRTCLVDDRPEYAVRRFLGLVMRQYLTCHRPWWRHPRCHVRHWRVRFRPWLYLKRVFQKCHGCGKRLGYGYSPTAAGGEMSSRTGKWEPYLFHGECARSASAATPIPWELISANEVGEGRSA